MTKEEFNIKLKVKYFNKRFSKLQMFHIQQLIIGDLQR